MKAKVMGIDLGTSSLKAVLMDEAGTVYGQSSREYRFDSPHAGWAEQDPADWWAACTAAVREALDKAACSVNAVAFSAQMHGLIPLDKDMQVIRPAILHCDARSNKQVEEIKYTLAEKNLDGLLYNAVYTGFMLTSLVWMRENEADNFARIRHVCLPKDYLKYKLCGVLQTDYSDAAGTGVFDVKELRWQTEFLDALNIPADIFPPVGESAVIAGKVTQEAARETGLSAGTAVVCGSADAAAQCIGNGAVAEGSALINFGSSGSVLFPMEHPVRNPALSTNTFCHYRKGLWYTMGAMMSAGLCFKWISNTLGVRDYAALDAKIDALPPGGGLVFLPYLAGERCPHLNPKLSGAFLGLNLNTTPAALARAVMEGVTFALYQCCETCAGLGVKADKYIVTGGAVHSRIWPQMMADIFNAPLRAADSNEQAAFGAAILALSAFSGEDAASICMRIVHYRDTVWEPRSEFTRVYREHYELFKDAYKAGSGILERATGLAE
jgi:xylulokinase